MKSPNKPDVLEEEIESILNSFSDAITSTNYDPKPSARLKAKQRIKDLLHKSNQSYLHKSQVKELVEEIKTNIKKYNVDENLIEIVDEALIDKLGKD